MIVPFADLVLSIESGKRPRGGVGTVKAGVLSLGGEHIMENGSVNLSIPRFIPVQFYNSLKKGKLKPNDILIVKDGATTGRVAIMPDVFSSRAAANEHIFVVRTDQRKVLQQFAFHFLRSAAGQAAILSDFRGAAQGGIGRTFVDKIRIPLPPLDEQRRIVDILNRAARIERLCKQAQALMREFIPALFAKIFGDPATNPMGWDKQKLGEVCFETEQRDPRKNPAKEFRYVDISGIDNVSKKVNEFRLILGSEAPSRARKEVKRNDILVSSVRPNLNAVAIIPDHLDDGIASTGFCILRADRKILNPLYLFLYVTSAHFIDIMVSKARGANYPAVSDKDIKDIQIPLPPLHIQRRFSDIAEAAQNAVERMELGDRTAAALSASLMSRLLEDAI